MIKLGDFFKTMDYKLFFSAIDQSIAENGHKDKIDWIYITKNPQITGDAGIIAKFKAGLFSEQRFVGLMLRVVTGLEGLVTEKQFIDAWNSMLDLKAEDIAEIKQRIQALPKEEFLSSDSNLTHQQYIAKLFAGDYIEAIGSKPHAILCGKKLIRSYDIGVTSSVLPGPVKNTRFIDAAEKYYREICEEEESLAAENCKKQPLLIAYKPYQLSENDSAPAQFSHGLSV